MLSNALGLGGTEKGLESFARELDRSAFDVAVVAVDETGPRQARLEAAGIPVACADGDEDRLAELLADADVAHVFRAGATEPIVPAASARAGVPHLVESNIFGQLDRSADEARFDCHLFGSQMCLMRYRQRLGGAGAGFHARHRVLPFPIEHDELRRDAPSPRDARRLLGLDPDRPVVGRVGRAADLKWRDLLVDMVPPLLRLVPDAQVLFVGATEAKRERLRRLGVLDRCVLAEPTLDPTRLAAYYAACDVFVSAAEIGESQGMSIGEALALEIPVVTCSTPWVDNAQVEFVEHGRSGWLASHPASFAEAVADLLLDDERRRAFGAAGRAGVEDLLSAGPLTRRLESLYRALLCGAELADWSPSPAEVEAFEGDYPRRAAAEFRPLSRAERAHVMEDRVRERARRTSAALRHRGGAAVRDRLRELTGRGAAASDGKGARLSDRLSRLESGGLAFRVAYSSYLKAHRAAERAGLHVVRASYDSPIPVVHRLPDDVFGRANPMRGVDWQPARQAAWVERELGAFLAEFRPEVDPDAPVGVFRLGNNTYDQVDAELLYAMLRRLKPRRYVELGSGYSTLVAWEALERNRAEGHPAKIACYDPFPSPHVLARPELAECLAPVSAERLPEQVVAGLESGDVLFVDTSHTVKLGGDVNRIVLELLPLAAPGVVVHFHDVFLPRDYFRSHVDGAHYWTEQYLLQAFLSGNGDWEVLAGAQAVALEAPELLSRLIPSYREGVEPGAFWIRRRAGQP
ncbi:MAG: hypothetical protein QOH58_2511 [Thermoleophilaceae bacterium]|nr:hypothetical protein [Thermoleophilaceae bacterium]